MSRDIHIPDAGGELHAYRLIELSPPPGYSWLGELTRLDNEDTYDVSRNTMGMWFCTCPDMRFSRRVNRGHDGPCKHCIACQEIIPMTASASPPTQTAPPKIVETLPPEASRSNLPALNQPALPQLRQSTSTLATASDVSLQPDPWHFPEIAKALAVAQAKCQPVPLNGEVKGGRVSYRYPKAKDVTIQAQAALEGTGLSLVSRSPRPRVFGAGNLVCYSVVYDARLIHTSGEVFPLGETEWPVETLGGQSLSKAYAAAITTSLSYHYQHLLRMAVGDPDEDQAGNPEPAQPPQQQPPPPPPRSTATTGITDAQAARIDALVRAVNPDMKIFTGWVKKMTGTERLPDLTAGQADSVIVGLERRAAEKGVSV